jgi:hydroxyethylthiazole kinase-like uncharacterized protein yjeF
MTLSVLDFPRQATPGLAPITAAQARALDQWAAHTLGMPTLLLMEHAGLAVARVAKELAGKGEVWIACGPGNNGGDGLAACRLLHPQARAFLVRAPDAGKAPEAARQLRILEQAGVAVVRRREELSGRPVLLVDALLGTGVTRPVEGEVADTIRWMNGLDVPILAVDLPSGMHADTGEALGVAVRAQCTVTFARPKLGLTTEKGWPLAGRVLVASLGIPETAIAQAPWWS